MSNHPPLSLLLCCHPSLSMIIGTHYLLHISSIPLFPYSLALPLTLCFALPLHSSSSPFSPSSLFSPFGSTIPRAKIILHISQQAKHYSSPMITSSAWHQKTLKKKKKIVGVRNSCRSRIPEKD